MNVFKLNEYIDAFLNIALIYISPIDIQEKELCYLMHSFSRYLLLTFLYSRAFRGCVGRRVQREDR